MPTPKTAHDLPAVSCRRTVKHACGSVALGRALLLLAGTLGLLALTKDLAALEVITAQSQRTQLALTGTWTVSPVPDGGQPPVTLEVPAKVQVPRRNALPWMLDEAGELRPEFAAEYVLGAQPLPA